MMTDPPESSVHRCEVCGNTEQLTSQEAFDQSWDYPPQIGAWGVASPRTYGGDCPMDKKLWWALQMEGLDHSDPRAAPEQHRKALTQILDEKTGDGR